MLLQIWIWRQCFLRWKLRESFNIWWLSLVIQAITFSRAGIFFNPSRAAPHHVKPATTMEDSRSNYALLGNATKNFQYAVFTSVIAVTQSNLHDSEPSGMFRQVSGTLCTLEWERLCAFFCMVFKEKELHAQIYEDALTFSTRARPRDAVNTVSKLHCRFSLWFAKPSAGMSKSRLISRGSPSKSPVKVTGSTGSGSVKGALNFEDTGENHSLTFLHLF
jgi:hypothetical protein